MICCVEKFYSHHFVMANFKVVCFSKHHCMTSDLTEGYVKMTKWRSCWTQGEELDDPNKAKRL